MQPGEAGLELIEIGKFEDFFLYIVLHRPASNESLIEQILL